MKVVRLSSLHTSCLYLQEIFLVLISGRCLVDSRAIMQPEGLYQSNIPVTPLGIKSATFQLVAQCQSLYISECKCMGFFEQAG